MLGDLNGVSFNPIYKDIAALLNEKGLINLLKVDYSNKTFEILVNK
jgi:hypothetical protein